VPRLWVQLLVESGLGERASTAVLFGLALGIIIGIFIGLIIKR
jgi:hypothetical protein